MERPLNGALPWSRVQEASSHTQQRTVIRNYVVKERVRPIELRDRVVVGVTIPAEIELTPVPETI